MLSIGNLIQKCNDLEREIAQLQACVEKDDGRATLVARAQKNGKFAYSKKIVSEDGIKKEIYLPQSARKEMEELAYKGYAKKRLIDARNEKHLLEEELELRQKESHVSSYFRKHPGMDLLLAEKRNNSFREMLTADEETRKKRAIAWNKEPYERSRENLSNLTIPTGVPNLFVRSKSEALIVGRFESFSAAYHYEEVFVPNKSVWLPAGMVFHPDFKCLNIRSGKYFWWEHQGQWDNPEYTKNLAKREAYLYSLGLVPWKNLIITTETQEETLDLEWVDWIIKYYLL